MYYKCTKDLYSIVIPNYLKFNKDGIYECIQKDVYLNNNFEPDNISIEGWQEFFIPIDIDNVDINEIKDLLQPPKPIH